MAQAVWEGNMSKSKGKNTCNLSVFERIGILRGIVSNRNPETVESNVPLSVWVHI